MRLYRESCGLIRRLDGAALRGARPAAAASAAGATRPPATRSPRILEDVLPGGDEAVREYTRRFDGVDLPPAEWELDPAAWQGALDRIAPALRAALALAVDRVREYHQHQRESGFTARSPDGSLVGMKVTPLDRVGLYVPGGKASYPSSVVMNAVPARGGRRARDRGGGAARRA